MLLSACVSVNLYPEIKKTQNDKAA